MVLKKHVCVCVFCFLRCLLSLHLSFVWNYSYYTSTELLARYKCMWISLFTSICLPNVFRKNSPSPHFSHKNICNSLLCDDLLRKLQRGVCIFSFSFFYHLCGSYYVHSNIVYIKGSIQACFLNFHVSNTSLPYLFIRLTLEFTWCLTFSS